MELAKTWQIINALIRAEQLFQLTCRLIASWIMTRSAESALDDNK